MREGGGRGGWKRGGEGITKDITEVYNISP